jgi:6-phosphogluconolactonase
VSATPGAKPTVEVYPDAETLANAAAALVARSARASVDERGAFTLVLSGGSTPRRTYELLADTFSRFVPWDRTHVFFSDERVVPASDPRNNYAMARDALLSRVPIPPSHVHPMPTEGAVPSELAARYESGLRSHFASASRHRAEPICDLAVMGVGADGHTASLFPGAAELSEGTVVRDRLTLTLPVLNRTRRVVFLVNGAEKSDALARVLRPESGDVEAPPPAALVHGLHSTEWLIDSEVAAGMRD